MRALILLFFWLCSFLSFANEVAIETIKADGLAAYELLVANYAQENTAMQVKLKLSSMLHAPIKVHFNKKNKLYSVKVGPLATKEEAINLQKKLNPLLLPTATSSSQAEAKRKAPSLKGEKLWNLSNADIRAVIAEVSHITGKNFLIDPRVQGKVSIVSSTPLSNQELYQTFLSILQVSGFAATPSGDIIKIVPNIDAKNTSYDISSRPYGDDILTEVIPVHYVPAEQLVPALRPLLPQWASVSAYSPSNMLILSGRANTIARMASIIMQVDSSSVDGIDVIPLKNVLAMDIVSTLKELIKKQTSSTGGRAPTMLASDDRNNSVLISGNKTERIRLRLLIEQLDHQGSTLSNTQVIYLSYLRAEDLAPILAGVAQANFSGNVGTTIGTITVPALDSTNPASSLANGNSSSSGSGGSIGGGGAANNAYTGNPGANTQGSRLGNTSSASTQNEGSTKPTVQIIAEPNTNSVIINAPISVIQILRSVIKQLDIKPAQLLIEAMVAEINRSDVVDLGIEWGMNVKTSDGASFKPGFAIINPTDQLSDFQAEIYALADDKRANILSTPSVVVLDNREAKILVGKQLNVPSTTYPNNANGTTNSGSPYTTFDRVNAALHLYVRPQITHDGGIQLQIDQGNEVVEPGTQDSDNPIFDISSIVTSVHINNGDTVVLGGLIQDSISNEEKKIPIVGDIPGIGTLFQHTNKDTEKRILMVFIRTTVLKNRRDAFQVSTAKYNRMRTEQLDFIRQQYYGKNNSDSILSPLNEANLPKPFSRPHATIVRKRT